MVFDSRLFGHRDMMHWNASVEVDISDAVPLAYWFDAVMHFAAVADIANIILSALHLANRTQIPQSVQRWDYCRPIRSGVHRRERRWPRRAVAKAQAEKGLVSPVIDHDGNF